MSGVRIAAWILGLSLGASLYAQTNVAQLAGRVSDPSGAAIAGARLTLTDPASGASRGAVSDARGEFAFLAVPPGLYRLRAQAAGFTPREVTGVTLTVGEQARVNVTLAVGSVRTEVQVSAAPATVETTRTSVATTIGQRAIANLPSNGRSYINFTLLDSATTRDNQPVLAPAPTSGLNFGGQRARANSVTIDGVEANDAAINGVRATLSQEAVQEFQILTSGYQAEYGRAAAAQINIVSKRGDNQTRGDVFAYLRNRNLDAVNAFANEPNPPDTRLQTGFTLGGPIQKDQTFYFFSFETTQQHSTGFSQVGRDNFGLVPVPNPFGGNVAVPLPAGVYEAAASATALLTPAQAAYIAQTAAAQPQAAASYYVLAGAASNLALTGTAAGNGFAVANGNPAAFALTGLPLPPSYTPLESLVGDYPATTKAYFGSLRLDRQLNGENSVFIRASLSPSFVTGVPSNGENQTTALNAASRTTATDTHDFSLAGQLLSARGPDWLNELHAQFSRHALHLLPASTGVAVELPGVASFGQEPFAPEERVEKHIEIGDNVTHVMGRHTLKFGVDSEVIPTQATFPLNQAGIYFFASSLPVSDALFGPLSQGWAATGAPDFTPAQAYGWGAPQSFVQQFGGAARASDHFQDGVAGAFVQDSFQVSRRLTLNYGLRYDLDVTPVFPPANATAAFAQSTMGVVKGIPDRYKNFSPRAGFAFDPAGDGKQVVRGYYGIFYGHPLLGLAFLSDIVDGVGSPYLIAPHLVGADDLFQGGAFTPFGLLANPALGYLPAQQRFDPLSPAFLDQAFALGVSPVLPQTLPVSANFKFDYAEQGGFGYERQLSAATSLDLQWNVTHGVHLLRPRNINQGNPALLQAYLAALAGQGPLLPLVQTLGAAAPLGRLIFNDFRPSGPNYVWTQAALGIPMAQLRQLAEAFQLPTGPAGGLVPYSNVKNYESSGGSVYHGFTATLRHRYSNRFQALVSYTWSHAIDDSTDLQTLQEPESDSQPGLDRGNSNFDQRHRFVLSGVWNLPGPAAGGAHALLANWTLAPIVELASGRPYNLITNQDQMLVNNDSDARPSVVPLNTPGSYRAPDGKAGLILPAPFTLGTLGRNVYRMPAFYSADVRLAKQIPLCESASAEFSVDAFNLFNHVNVREADNSYTNGGRPVAAFDPRQIQLGLKISF